MIAAHELRIGNWIDYLGKLVKCDIRTIYAVCKVVGESTMYRPIPLTPEILVRCGFDKVYESKMHTNYDADKLGHAEIGYTIWHNSGNRFFRYYSERNVICQYLHQLQNLYFALTNEELKIEL